MDNYVVKPIERRIRYLFRFPKIVQGLHEQKKNLIREQTRVNEDVKEAKLQIQTQVIEDYVTEWLSDAENALKDAQSLDNRIDENKRCLHWCPNWSWRYRLSKEIEEKTVDICKLVEGSHFERIGHGAVVPDLELLPPEGIVTSKSSTVAFNKIMEALEDDEIKMIGVWGMGGVAWALFKMKAELDERLLSRDIVEEAKKVAQECKGLPVAIVTVASALKDTRSRKGWELARKKLESSRLPEIGNIEEREVENAYRCIKMSFDYLKKATTKRCFLFCALYPEDHSIPVEDLVRYAWGLELYGLADSVEDVRIQVLEAIKFLKESCLLLEDEDVGRYVKLHDIVRDVALWITSKPESGFTIKTRLDGSFEPCKAISLLNNEEKNLPEKLAHSDLQMLLLNNCDVQITCFQGMRELKVLSLTLARASPKIISLYALRFLEKLRTLHLKNFEDLSFLGNLGALEILTLRESSLEGFAKELERLENLKILDITRCTLSSRFPTNVIGRMFKLEELYLQGNSEGVFDDTIPDINSLSSLTALSLQVSSFQLLEGFEFSKLERYNISIGKSDNVLTEKSWEIYEEVPLNVVSLLPESLESLKVSASTDEFMECLIAQGSMLSNLKVLLVGNWSGITELPAQHVRVEGLVDLRIKYCSSLELLFPLSLVQSLVSLESLEISDCHGLKQLVTESEGDEVEEEINSHHSHFVCFPNLRKVDIKECDSLEYIFPALMGKQGHQGLSLSISYCSQLKQVIKVENDVMLQQLQFLETLSSFYVRECPLLIARLQATRAALQNVCLSSFKGSFNRSKHLQLRETIEDHNMVPDANGDGLNGLTSLVVEKCNDFECLVDTTKGNGPTSVFTHLETLKINKSNGLETLCKGQPPHGFLKNLKELFVRKCSKLQVVFQMGDLPYNQEQIQGIFKGPAHSFSLQSLEIVEIEKCSKLESLFSPSLPLCLPKLKTLHISYCSKLECVVPITLAQEGLPALESLQVLYCDELKQVFGMGNGQDGVEHHHHGEIESNTSPLPLPLCLPKLKTLYISRCSKLECVVPITLAQEGLPALESIEVLNCEELKQVFGMGNGQDGVEHHHHGEIESNTSPLPLCLPKLKTLYISWCSKLECIVPITLAQEGLPALESIEVWKCKELKQVFGMGNGQDGVEHHHHGEIESNTSPLPLCLSKLKTLRIYGCSKLKYVVPITLAQEGLPALESLKVFDCEELKQVFGMGNGQDGVEHHHHGEIESNTSPLPLCLPKLKTLYISWCSKLECIVPITLAQEGLPALESLGVWECEELKQVFGMGNGQDGVEHHHHGEIESNTSPLPLPLCLPKLKTLDISYCSKLECVVPITLAQEGLPALESLQVSYCDELKQVFGMGNGQDGVEHHHHGEIESNTSPLPLPLCLPKLKTLDISYCSKLECVVPENYIVKAPVLKSIRAYWCPQVTNIPIQQASKQLSLETNELSLFKKLSYNTDQLYLKFVSDHKILVPGADLGHLDRLTSLDIVKCNGCECLVDTSEAMKGQPFLQSLKTLTIDSCDDMLEVIRMDEGLYNRWENQPPLLSNLEHLKLWMLDKLREIVKGPTHCVNLQCLKVIYITGCWELRWLFSVSVVQTLVSLEQLKITKCFELKSVFTELDGTEPDTLCLPNLKTMEIEDCESLEYVFPLALAASFPRLQEIKLDNLESLGSIVEGNICLEAPALQIFDVRECSAFADINLLKQVNNSVPLKELTYSSGGGGVESKNMENSHLCRISSNLIGLRDIWKGPINVATNLKEVVISKCNSLTYIFPVMLVPHLPQLSSLKIKSCEKLKQIIVNDDILASSSSSQGTRLEKKMEFPQLKEIILEDLPRLESFIPEGYHLELPCLEELELVQYYKMITSFTVDYLTLTVHAKTNRASQADAQQDIHWERRRFSSLPQYVEEAEEISPLK
ncbi:hypothetical protein V6N13_129004 [Hibiscus sabdariffa]